MFKKLFVLRSSVEDSRRHKATALSELAAINGKLSAISRDLKDEVIQAKTVEIRNQHSENIVKSFGAVKTLADDARRHEQYWNNKPFLLSLKPITPAFDSQPLQGPKDAALEAATRLATMTEAKLMPSTLLHLRATAAINSGRYGEAFLLSLENDTRHQDKDYQPVSFERVELPEQREALRLISEIKQLEAESENLWRESTGAHVPATARLTAARMHQANDGGDE